jgi:hypothetical protein
VVISNNVGNTNNAANNDIRIIIAVRIPNDANNGIGANPIIRKPTTEDAADPKSAMPVPLIVVFST